MRRTLVSLGSRWGWVVIGLMLIAIHAIILALSPRFAYGELPVLERPTGWIVALMMGAGTIYLCAIWWLKLPARPRWPWWAWIITVGVVMRVLMLPSTPILETDYFRYLWDGAVIAHGQNPYAHSPQAVLDGDAPANLIELGQASGVVLERVNEPRLTTIYPLSAQAAFAVSHVIWPWDIKGLRLTFGLIDVLTLLLLIGLLRQLTLPASYSLIYWWNPLLIKEGFNTAHMEMVLLPLIVAAVWLAARWRIFASMTVLALAIGAKLWPALLLPVMLWQRGREWTTMGVGALLCAALAFATVAPMLIGRLDPGAGVVAYASRWQVNASLFQLFPWLASWTVPADPQLTARIMVALLVLGWTAWLCRTPAPDGRAVGERTLWIIAGLFLLSPTQYPWYWLWLLPMLAIYPSPGLLVLTVTLPMYYLRFPMRELDLTWWFNHGVVWLQFIPAYVLLALEAWRRLRHSDRPDPPIDVAIAKNA